MCRNRKHNRADFSFLNSVCKASSLLPLLLFSHCLLSKSLSVTSVCVYVLWGAAQPSIPMAQNTLCFITYLALSAHCHVTIHAILFWFQSQFNWKNVPSVKFTPVISSCQFFWESMSGCPTLFFGLWKAPFHRNVCLCISKRWHKCMYFTSWGGAGCSSESCSKMHQHPLTLQVMTWSVCQEGLPHN